VNRLYPFHPVHIVSYPLVPSDAAPEDQVFSTQKLYENQPRPLTAQNLRTLSLFLDLRPDGCALHQKHKRLVVLIQLNFMVGVRGSISHVDRIAPLFSIHADGYGHRLARQSGGSCESYF
jgi:hypothetical protein